MLSLAVVGLVPYRPLPDRRAMVLGAAAAVTLAPSRPATAWCGESFPPWAYYLKWDELAVPFQVGEARGQVFCRIVGDIAREQKSGCPPLLLVGTPGLSYEYLENLEALTVSDRRVVEVTFAGTSASDKAVPPELLTIDSCAAQLRAVCGALKLPTVHVIAHGLGGAVAIQLARAEAGSGPGAQPLALRSLTLISPYGGASDLRPVARENVGDGKSPTARRALLPTLSTTAKDSCIQEAVAPGSGPLLSSLLASSSTPLAGSALARQLSAVQQPVMLVSGGEADIVNTDGWVELPKVVRTRDFADAGHLPFVDVSSRNDVLYGVLDFLDEADGVETNRELKFADPVQTIKELSSPAAAKDCSTKKTEKAREYCEAQNAKAVAGKAAVVR